MFTNLIAYLLMCIFATCNAYTTVNYRGHHIYMANYNPDGALADVDDCYTVCYCHEDDDDDCGYICEDMTEDPDWMDQLSCDCKKCQRDCSLEDIKITSKCDIEPLTATYQNDASLPVTDFIGATLEQVITDRIPLLPGSLIAFGWDMSFPGDNDDKKLWETIEYNINEKINELQDCMYEMITDVLVRSHLVHMRKCYDVYNTAKITTGASKIDTIHDAWSEFKSITNSIFVVDVDDEYEYYGKLLLHFRTFSSMYSLVAIEYMIALSQSNNTNFEAYNKATITSLEVLENWANVGKCKIVANMRKKLHEYPCKNDDQLNELLEEWQSDFFETYIKILKVSKCDLLKLCNGDPGCVGTTELCTTDMSTTCPRSDNDGCVSSDSWVITYPGFVKKNVTYLKLGDKILTYDELQDKFVWDEVLARFHFGVADRYKLDANVPISMIELILNNKEILTLSRNHLLFTEDDELHRADHIRIGDKLKFYDGNQVEVIGINNDVMKLPRNIRTYNGNLVVNGVAISSISDGHGVCDARTGFKFSKSSTWRYIVRTVWKYGYSNRFGRQVIRFLCA